MEQLVVTLAHMAAGRDTDALALIRLVTDTVRSAPGINTAKCYRSCNTTSHFLLLTTWEDTDSWHKARDRYSPRDLLLTAADLLAASPEQWQMEYLWGYRRPIASSALNAVHLASIRPAVIEQAQQTWIQGLQQQTLQPTLAFAFLARGMDDDVTALRKAYKPGVTDAHSQAGSILLNFFSWGSDEERSEFYEDATYRAMHTALENAGSVRILSLEPII